MPHDPEQLRGWLRFAIARYLFNRPGDAGRLGRLREAVERGDDLGSRATLPLHVTASAIALDPTRTMVLTLEHAALGRRLPPGGHLEAGELPAWAAGRELVEEAGLEGRPLSAAGGAIDVEVHAIPANPARGEPAHEHADFAYLFMAEGTPRGEAGGPTPEWRDVATLGVDERGARILSRLSRMGVAIG